MLCNQCQSNIPEDAQYCPNCGTIVEKDVFDSTDNIQSQVQSQSQPYNESKTLMMGIIGVIASFLFFMGIPFVQFVGIFLGRQGIIYAKQDKALSGQYSKNGQLLSWIALILGIFGILINVIYVIINPDVVNA